MHTLQNLRTTRHIQEQSRMLREAVTKPEKPKKGTTSKSEFSHPSRTSLRPKQS